MVLVVVERSDYAVQAALVAAQVQRPVQLIWSREETFARPLSTCRTSRFRGTIDANGDVASWENTYVDKHEPAEAPLIPMQWALKT